MKFRKNIFVIGAHPDDLECMAGGSIARFVLEGKRAHCISLSQGSWMGPNGQHFRAEGAAIKEMEEAAKILGYSFEIFNLKTLELRNDDDIRVVILKRISQLNIDTIICPYSQDLHPDHAIASEIALSVSRRVPRVLMGQINWYISKRFFSPNIFVDISKTFRLKIRALSYYRSEMQRVGETWQLFFDSISKYYGLTAGFERAEGFISPKFSF